jgi:crotonobetainyl-CoA:carnitine CoA-transferase CaiB-like acyl-CoA transferase
MAVNICWCSLLATVVCKVLPKVGPRLLKFPPLFLGLNTAISAAIANLSWSELTTLFQQHDVWYCPVNTPASALRFPQAQECKIFEAHATQLGEGVRVSSPISLSGVSAAQTLPAPPTLGRKIN